MLDTTLLLVMALAAAAVFVALTVVRQITARPVFVRGAAIAIVAAALVGLVAFAAAILLPGGDITQALLIGAVVAGGFLWLNLVVLSIGLWFRPTRDWALGACLSTPVVLAAIGFGYVAYRAWPLQ